METSAILPEKICRQCANRVTAFMPFIALCKKSAKIWNNVADYVVQNGLTRINKRAQSLFVVVEATDGSDVTRVTDKVKYSRPKKNRKIVLKNFQVRLSRAKAIERRNEREKLVTGSNLKCPECSTFFSSLFKLRQHLKDTAFRVCNICHKVVSKKSVKDHLEKHQVTVYACNVCDDCFDDPVSYVKHAKRCHSKGGAFCSMCTRSFSNDTALAAHLRTHKAEVCNGCRQVFKHKLCFIAHSKTCPNAKPMPSNYICDYCFRCYEFKQALVIHIQNRHAGGGQLLCSYCDKRFGSQQGLLEHEKIHQERDKYICDRCGGEFMTRRGYRGHIKGHVMDGTMTLEEADQYMKLRVYNCRVCSRGFRRINSLKIHLQAKHNLKVDDLMEVSVC